MSLEQENIYCSDCENFTVKDRRIEGKATIEQFGYCTHYEKQTSADSFYAVCPDASPISMEIEKPIIVKK